MLSRIQGDIQDTIHTGQGFEKPALGVWEAKGGRARAGADTTSPARIARCLRWPERKSGAGSALRPLPCPAKSPRPDSSTPGSGIEDLCDPSPHRSVVRDSRRQVSSQGKPTHPLAQQLRKKLPRSSGLRVSLAWDADEATIRRRHVAQRPEAQRRQCENASQRERSSARDQRYDNAAQRNVSSCSCSPGNVDVVRVQPAVPRRDDRVVLERRATGVKEHAEVTLGRRQQTEVGHGEVGAEEVPEPADDARVVLPARSARLLLRSSGRRLSKCRGGSRASVRRARGGAAAAPGVTPRSALSRGCRRRKARPAATPAARPPPATARL